jgi:hypothetical protein
MIIKGGTNPQRWVIASTDYHSTAGRVIRRDVTITIGDTQLVLVAQDARRLAAALNLVAKNPATERAT